MAYQREIEKLEQRFNEKPEQWFAALADAYRKNGDLDLAIDVLQAWIPKRPNYTSGHIVLGRCYLDKEQDPEADQTFRQVIELDPENIIALKSLSEIATRRGAADEARSWLTQLLEADPMNDEAREALDGLDGGAEAPEAEAPPEPAEAGVGLGISVDEVATPETSSALAVESAPTPDPVAEPVPDAPEPVVDIAELAPDEPEAPETDTALEPVGADEPTMLMGGAAPAFEDVSEPAAESADDGAATASTAEVEEAASADTPDIDATMPMSGLDDAPPEEATVIEGLSVAQIPTQPMDPVEGSTGDEPTVFEMEAFQVEEAEEIPESVEPAEGFVTVDGASAEPGDEVEKESFDEDLGWDQGDRTSKQITAEDVAAAEREHADGFVTVDGAADATDVAALDVENYENAIDMTPAPEPVDTGAAGVFQDDDFGADSLTAAASDDTEAVLPTGGATFDPDATVPVDAESLTAATAEPDASLDLIMPEDVADTAPAEPADAAAAPTSPEPVVTLTMAEVYQRQGHVDQARDIVSRLLDDDPENEVLRAKLAELDAPSEPEMIEPPGEVNDYAVATTGGSSVRDMLAQMAAGSGAAADAAPSPSSFDAFFGESAPADASSPADPVPETGADPAPEGGEDFSDWLKGLKT
jgi:thioredoxin-like negative regulator of GroEL